MLFEWLHTHSLRSHPPNGKQCEKKRIKREDVPFSQRVQTDQEENEQHEFCRLQNEIYRSKLAFTYLAKCTLYLPYIFNVRVGTRGSNDIVERTVVATFYLIFIVKAMGQTVKDFVHSYLFIQ